MKRMNSVLICVMLLILMTGCVQKELPLHCKEDPSIISQNEKEEDDQIEAGKKQEIKSPLYPKTGAETVSFLVYEVQPGDTLYDLFGPRNWKMVAKLNRVSPQALMPGMKLLVPRDMEIVKNECCPLPERIEKNVELVVDLEEQAVGRYEDHRLQNWYPITSGKKGYATPTGLFQILQKETSYKSHTYPKPHGGASMPYAMRFYGGYWIHGGILPGKPASHGCVRLMIDDAQELFKDSRLGDRVFILGGSN